MIRHAAAVVVALFVSSTPVLAQTPMLTVSTSAAEVHKFPSIGSPVIGKAPRGAALEVRREIGDWVRVAWPGADDGVAYVRLSDGTIGRGAAVTANRSAASASAASTRSGATPASPTTTAPPASQTSVARQLEPRRAAYVAPPTHFVGLGAQVGQLGGSTIGFGGGARAWTRGPLGLQLQISRYEQSNALAPARVTSTQVAPSVLYAFSDRVGDYIWMRPYLGVGANVRRSTLSGMPGEASLSEGGLGMQTFGGGELTFASMPRFALSVDVGYRWEETSFVGFEPGGLGFAVSGHWYVK
jgi:SH3 domain-containing protein